MAHDREFQRKRKDTRMPVRDSHGEDQPAARQTEQDFDLRRARDTPSSVNGKTHRQDIPVQTEFSHLSPETPASLLEQGEAYATALDGFSEHFETPDATRTAPPIQDNVRSNFWQEASRRSFVTEDVTDHDTGKYAPSSEGSAPPNGTDRSGQEHRYRTHQHGNKYQQRFQEAAQAEEQEAQKEIQIFHTILATPDNKMVYIPNGSLSSGAVTNFSRQATRRVDWTFGVDYGEDYDKVKAVIETIIARDSRILTDPAPFIALHALADSSVNIVVRVWVESPNYWEVYFGINQAVYATFNEKGINFPFPQLTVHRADN